MHASQSITAVILAGGRGSRMGGVDKGLQSFNGVPLALHALMRLQMQEGSLIAETMVNANRNLAAYEAMGVSVWPDASPDAFAGPLAGFLTGLERCETPLLLTVPCDSPLFPLDLVQRLHDALENEQADIAVASAPEPDEQDTQNGTHTTARTTTRPQPVFCLMRSSLMESLVAFMQSGGRKIDAWTAQHTTVFVPFDLPSDNPQAFANANTLAELQALQA
jgi:molybdenum cofactor guanylyltransferase